MEINEFLKFEMIINVLVFPLNLITYVMGLSSHQKYYNSFGAGTVYRFQILKYKDFPAQKWLRVERGYCGWPLYLILDVKAAIHTPLYVVVNRSISSKNTQITCKTRLSDIIAATWT